MQAALLYLAHHHLVQHAVACFAIAACARAVVSTSAAVAAAAACGAAKEVLDSLGVWPWCRQQRRQCDWDRWDLYADAFGIILFCWCAWRCRIGSAKAEHENLSLLPLLPTNDAALRSRIISERAVSEAPLDADAIEADSVHEEQSPEAPPAAPSVAEVQWQAALQAVHSTRQDLSSSAAHALQKARARCAQATHVSLHALAALQRAAGATSPSREIDRV
jgi:hypothetical protein